MAGGKLEVVRQRVAVMSARAGRGRGDRVASPTRAIVSATKTTTLGRQNLGPIAGAWLGAVTSSLNTETRPEGYTGQVRAQSAVPDADTIRPYVKVGQKVTITDVDGVEHNGRIDTIAVEGLGMREVGDKSTNVPYGRILRIDHPEDTLSSGAWIGFGIGAGVTLVSLATYDDGCNGKGLQWLR